MPSSPAHGDGSSISAADTIATRQQFAETLTQLRERAGLTVRDVAKAASIPYSTVGGYMSGRHLPPVSEAHALTAILRACGVVDGAEVERWRLALSRVRRLPGPRPADAPAPYKGLSSYEPGDSEWFFGREKLTATVVDVLAGRWATGSGPVAVLGPSGCGKSSLLRAGVTPILRAGGLHAAAAQHESKPSAGTTQPWNVLLFTPGKHPVDAFATALAAVTDPNAEEIGARLRRDARGYFELLHDAVGACPDGGPAGLAVVVDQFEEVFTECGDDGERRAFFAALHACATTASAQSQRNAAQLRPAAAVLIGLRADFYHRALLEPQLVPVLQQAQVPVGPMSEAELRQAILGPAHKAGLEIEDGLVELLLRDLAPPAGAVARDGAHEAGALPVLSHTLRAMWELATRRRMTVADYQAVGGARGAVARTADDLLNSLSDPDRRLAKRLFVRLVRVQEDGPNTRRRLTLAELDRMAEPAQRDDLRAVMDRFVTQRLIALDADAVQLAHEALVVAWPRLRMWIEANRRGLLIRQQIGDSAQQWHREGRDPSLLYRGSRLSAAHELIDARDDAGLDDLAREFLRESARRERQRVRTLYQTVAALATLLLVALGGGTVAIVQSSEALRQRALATDERNAALSRLMAIRADRLRDTDPALAGQLALAAYQIMPTTEARSSLLDSSAIPAVTRMLGAGSPLQAIAVAPDRGLLAGAGTDGRFRLWNLTDPNHPAAITDGLPSTVGAINTMAFHPQQRLLLAGGSEGVQFYDTSVPAEPIALDARLEGGVTTLSFGAGGALLAATTTDGAIRLWNLSEPTHPIGLGTQIAGPADGFSAAALSPDGSVLAAAGADRRVYLWDIREPAAPARLGKPLAGPDLSIFGIAFSPDGRTFAAASADRHVYLWDLTKPSRPSQFAQPLSGPTNWVHTVTFSPDGRTVAAGSSDGHAWLWQLDTGAVIATLPHPAPVTELAFDRDGLSLYSGASDGVVRRWALPGPVLSAATNTVHDLAWSGDLLVAASGDRAVYLWETGDPQRTVLVTDPLTSPRADSFLVGTIAISPNGRVLVASGFDGTVWGWDISTPSRPSPLVSPLTGLSRFAESLAFSPDGRLLAAGGSDGTIALWDMTDPQQPTLLATLDDATGNVYSVAFSPDGRWLAAGGFDTVVRLWDISSPADPVRIGESPTGAKNFVYSIAFHPAGRALAVSSADGTVRQFSLANPTRPAPGPTLIGPNGYVIGIAFSPDGTRLAASSTDHTVWLWDTSDLTNPTIHAILTSPEGPVQDVAFHRDGRSMAASSQDTKVRIWQTTPEDIAERACSVVGDPVTAEEWQQHVPDLPYRQPCLGPQPVN
ncbi:helix-turn-helix domain-containing protein [Micromonospora sp. NPDC003816]|uniref:nSTAND1 domain-containing NTPase n=1 Tax=Micromonospora sp. NPDC003816 TaxID=3364224 RepID=UPI0036792489